MRNLTLNFSDPESIYEINEDTEIYGLFVGRSSEQVKANLKFVHTLPHLTSRIHIKAVVYDKSKFDIEAKLIIQEGAVDTDTYLKIDCLILDPTAQARAVPSLEIKQDNVHGGHGATIGRIDEEQLHYLMSRGMDHKSAQELIVEAFIADMPFKSSSF